MWNYSYNCGISIIKLLLVDIVVVLGVREIIV